MRKTVTLGPKFELCLTRFECRSLELWMRSGCPAEKLVAGFAFYGRSMKGVTGTSIGLGASFSCKYPCFEPGSFGQEAVYDAQDLIDAENNGGVVGGFCSNCGGSGFDYYWDDAQSVPWLFNSDKNVFISFDNPRSICIKARWARDKDLRGGMFWELAGDDGRLQQVLVDIFVNGVDMDCDSL